MPYCKKLTEEELDIFRNHEQKLWELGFDIKIIGPILEIHSAPIVLKDINLDEFVYSVIDHGGEINFLKDLLQIKARFARIACRSAIKGGMKLTNEEIEYVIKYFFENRMPLQCPHGRPTVIIYSQTEVEKWFKRIV